MLVQRHLDGGHGVPHFFSVKTGDWRLRKCLQCWYSAGELTLQTSAAADIAAALYRLEATLLRPIIISPLPRDFFEPQHLNTRGITAADLIHAAAVRPYTQVAPQAKARFGGRIARIPLTPTEVKQCCRLEYREDEQKIIRMLEREGSIASSIHRTLHLNRDIIKAALKHLQDDRRPRVILSGIICDARFEQYDQTGAMQSVCCGRCQGADSLAHLLRCSEIGLPPSDTTKPEDIAAFSIRLARECAPYTPVWSLPVQQAQAEVSVNLIDGISFTTEEPGEASLNSLEEMSFDEIDCEG